MGGSIILLLFNQAIPPTDNVVVIVPDTRKSIRCLQDEVIVYVSSEICKKGLVPSCTVCLVQSQKRKVCVLKHH